MTAAMDTIARTTGAVPRTGDPDRGFAATMIPHHQGLLDMARLGLSHGNDPATRILAQDTAAAQDRNIALMNTWLAGHRPAK